MSSGLNFNYEREVEQLRIAIEFHEQQKGRLESRIRELKNELKSGRGKLSLVTGEMGAGTTTYGVHIAEKDANPIISNLESLEDAYYAVSWRGVEAILEEHPEQQFTILIDDCESLRHESDGFVQQVIKQGHHIILVPRHLKDVHPWLIDTADAEYHLPERGTVQYIPAGSDEVEYTASVGTPRRSFNTFEIPRFDFRKPPQAYPRAEFEDEDDSDDGPLDDIFSDDKIPPQFHLDELERELDYNLGQVDGFHDLDWKSKCDLAQLAVDHDLNRSELETVLDLNQGDDARGVSC
ncbi:hypothetical protein [Haloferax sp. Atlit-12N]|uniref:hypothetical protein n=1 Tax=Haloferax sp. Atlit-12N TaxID=2077203 RepID=UPI0011E5DEC4|nr:hypothetical protein [Haloferax sp. Atlit-12N]